MPSTILGAGVKTVNIKIVPDFMELAFKWG